MSIDSGPISELESMITFKKRKKPPHNSTWTAERESLLKEYLDQNLSHEEIAQKLDISISSVKGKINRTHSGYIKRTGPTPREIVIDQILKRKGIIK